MENNLPNPNYANPITEYSEERDWFDTIGSLFFGVLVVAIILYGTWHLGRYYEITHPRQIISPIPCSQMTQ